jgi:hypothetical protein
MKSQTLALVMFFAATAGLCASLPPAPAAMPKPPTAPLGSDLAPAPMWTELTAIQQKALSPLKDQFDSLPKQQRRKWRTLADRFATWPEDKQKIVQSRMLLWANMTQEQRAAARQQAMAARQDGNTNRSESWKKWMDLENESKDDLHGKAIGAATPKPLVPGEK